VHWHGQAGLVRRIMPPRIATVSLFPAGFRSISQLPSLLTELTMNLTTRITLAIIALAVLAGLYVGGRAELTLAQESTSQTSTNAPSLARAQADSFCFEQRGDGCWPQVYVEDNDQKMTARNDR
jgi:hypothetical protein